MDRTWRATQLATQVSRLKPTALLCVGMDERTGLECEGGNARCIAWSHFGCRTADRIRNSQRKLQRATRAVQNRAAACVAAGVGIYENQL